MSTDNQTRKDEIRYHTSDFDRAVGKYLASPVKKEWEEELTDASTGEMITIHRTEIIAERGKAVTPELAASFKFYAAAGDISEIEVSNQRRVAQSVTPSWLRPFRVNATIGRKKYSFLLQAQTPAKAIEVATDYIELTFTADFGITAVKRLDDVIILSDTFISIEEAATIAQAQAAEGAEGEDPATRADVKYYKVEAELTIKSDAKDEKDKLTDTFIVRTKDVDTAKPVIRAWIEAHLRRESEKDGEERELIEMAIQAAAPFSCNAIISREFCEAYKEVEK